MIAITEEQSTVQRVARDEGLCHADKLAELVDGLAALRRSACLDVDHLLCLAEIGRQQDEGELHGCQTLSDALCLPVQTVSRHITFLGRAGYLESTHVGGRRLRLVLSPQGREAVQEAAYVIARQALTR